MGKQSYPRTPQDIWFISGVSLAFPPWQDGEVDSVKSKAILLHPCHVRRLGPKFEKPPGGHGDDNRDFYYRKRTIWVNLVVLFRLLLMAQHLSFDHDNFWKFVRLKWATNANAFDTKYLVNLYADRRHTYLTNRHIQRRHVDLLTDLIDAWVARDGDLPLPRWPRREDITAEWERLNADWDRLLQFGDYTLLIDPDNPPTLGCFPEDRGTPAPFRIKGEGLRSRSQSTGYDRDHSSTRTPMRIEERDRFVVPPPRNNDPDAPPSPPSRPLTSSAMELAVDELIESEGNPAQKRKLHPDELDPTPTKRRCLEDDVPSPWARAPSPVPENVADATHSEPASSPTEKHTSHQLVAMIDQATSDIRDLEDRHKDRFDSLEQRAGEHRDTLQYLEEKAGEHANMLHSHASMAGEHGVQLLELETRTNAHQAKLASLESESSRHEEGVGSLEMRTGQHGGSLSSLETRTNAHEKQLSILEAKSDHNNARFCSLEEKTDKQETDLSFLRTKVGEHEKKFKSFQFHDKAGVRETTPGTPKVNDHAEALQSFQEEAGEDGEVLQSVKQRVDGLERTSIGQSHQLGNHQKQIGDYRAELDTLKLRLANSEEATSQLGKTSVLSAAFTILSSKVDGSLGRLDSMGNTVTQLTTSLNNKLNEHRNILNSSKASTAKLDKTNGESKAMLDSIEAKVGQQSEQFQTVIKTVDSLKVANDEFNTKVESLETDFGKYRAQFGALKTVVDGLEKTTSESANVATLEAAFGEHKDQFQTLQKAVGDFDRTTLEHDENIRELQEQMKLVQESGDLSRDVQKAHNDLTVFTASQCQTALEKLDSFAAELSSLRKEIASYRQTTDEGKDWRTQHEEAKTVRERLLSTIESLVTIRKGQKEQLDRDHKLEKRIKIADDRISRVDTSAKTTTKTLKGIQYRQQEFAEEVDDRLATTDKHLASVMKSVESLQKSTDESTNARLSKLESGLKGQNNISPAVEERLTRMEDAIQTNTTLIGNCRTLVEVSKTSLDQQFSTLGNRVSLLEQRLNRRMAEQEQSAKAQAMRMERLEAELEQQKGMTRQYRG
ncbi:hypothetical protein CcaCcLH18_03299 [Colletotrichum camelliae]|nr:hypothetical protein CcaCcLH18_03299 [Colletotrichum camelliae]